MLKASGYVSKSLRVSSDALNEDSLIFVRSEVAL